MPERQTMAEEEQKAVIEAVKSLNLWNLLGRGITIIMIPWMTWVTVMMQNVMQNQAVMADRMQNLPAIVAEMQSFRDRMTRMEVRFQYLESRLGSTP